MKAQYKRAATAFFGGCQIGTPFSGMPRSSSAGMQRNIRSFTTSAVCVAPGTDRRAFLILVPYLCALDTMFRRLDGWAALPYQNTGYPAETVVTFYICKKGSRWDKERQGKIEKGRFDDACRISPDLSRRHLHGQQQGNSLPIATIKIPRPKPRWSCSRGGAVRPVFISTLPVRQGFFGADL